MTKESIDPLFLTFSIIFTVINVTLFYMLCNNVRQGCDKCCENTESIFSLWNLFVQTFVVDASMICALLINNSSILNNSMSNEDRGIIVVIFSCIDMLFVCCKSCTNCCKYSDTIVRWGMKDWDSSWEGVGPGPVIWISFISTLADSVFDLFAGIALMNNITFGTGINELIFISTIMGVVSEIINWISKFWMDKFVQDSDIATKFSCIMACIEWITVMFEISCGIYICLRLLSNYNSFAIAGICVYSLICVCCNCCSCCVGVAWWCLGDMSMDE